MYVQIDALLGTLGMVPGSGHVTNVGNNRNQFGITMGKILSDLLTRMTITRLGNKPGPCFCSTCFPTVMRVCGPFISNRNTKDIEMDVYFCH